MASSRNLRGIYRKICSGKVPMEDIADTWVEDYDNNHEDAIVSLMQFLCDSSDCNHQITNEMFNMNSSAVLQEMTEALNMEEANYPIIMKGKKWKNFHNDFCEFLQCLVNHCQNTIIYDNYLMENILPFLIEMTKSKIRAFRHTSTLAVMKIMTALVNIAVEVLSNYDAIQLENEEQMKDVGDALKQKLDKLEDIFDRVYTSVFNKRYRDICSDIRDICMAEVGIWMPAYPQHFLSDGYKYLFSVGISLYDKNAQIRLKCVQSLRPLYASYYQNDEIISFTRKFKKRIVSMTYDEDIDVSVNVLKILTRIAMHYNDILTKGDYNEISELVFSKHEPVALAAGEFVTECLSLLQKEKEASKAHSDEFHKNAYMMVNLVQFFIECEHPELVEYFVDSMIRCDEIMKDWKCMIDLLLGECDEHLNHDQISALMKIMTCSIKRAATGKPPDRNEISKVPTTSSKTVIAEDQLHITQDLLPAMPSLLSKFKSDHAILQDLLLIPQYFQLDVLQLSQYKTEFDLLLSNLCMFAEEIENSKVLEICANTLSVFCENNFDECDAKRNDLLNNLIKTYQDVSSKIVSPEKGEILDKNELVDLKSVLKKLSIFSQYHDLEKLNIWDSTYKTILEMKYHSMELAGEIVKSCVSICFFSLTWNLHSIERAKKEKLDITEEVSKLKTRLSEFVEELKEILRYTSAQLSEKAYLCLCDLLVIFCERLDIELAQLVLTADDELIFLLLTFVEHHVFINEDDGSSNSRSVLENRRKLLSSFTKLVVYNMVPIIKFKNILKNYVKYIDEYGDIIAFTLKKALEINREYCAQTMVYCLISLMTPDVDRESCEFAYIKLLAGKFAESLGTNKARNRKAVLKIHQYGIWYAMKTSISDETPLLPNLAFLQILLEFVKMIPDGDKPVVLNYLNRQIPTSMLKNIKSEPLLLYQKSLGQKISTKVSGKTAPQKRRKDSQPNDAEDGTKRHSHKISKSDPSLREDSVSRDSMLMHSPASCETPMSTPSVSIIVTDASGSIHSSESQDEDFPYVPRRKVLSVIPE